MLNKVVMNGRLVREISLKTDEAGNYYTNFTLAVGRRGKSKNGEYETDFIPCYAYGKLAEFLHNHIKKGVLICVEGRNQSYQYDNKAGETVYGMKVFVEQIDFLEPKKKKLDTEGYTKSGESETRTEEEKEELVRQLQDLLDKERE